jgi:uncharacterized DUF497 family protein
MEIEFTWDQEKARRNLVKHRLVKHRVSFDVASQVFADPFMIVVEDCEVEGEIRYHAPGHINTGLTLVLVVFVDRSDIDREVIRIISAREADQYEQRTYADQFESGN